MSLLFRRFLRVTGRAGPGALSVQPQLGATAGCGPCHTAALRAVVPLAPSLGESSLRCSGGSTAESPLSLGQAVLSYRELEKQPVSADTQELSGFTLR